MGTQKSHFAYRLAWANTSSERIPFLPLHRRDLVFAEEGNETFLNEASDRVNWKKFDVMGEVLVGIQKSQGTPYPNICRNEDLQRLVLDIKFSKDDEVSRLFSELRLQVELHCDAAYNNLDLSGMDAFYLIVARTDWLPIFRNFTIGVYR